MSRRTIQTLAVLAVLLGSLNPFLLSGFGLGIAVQLGVPAARARSLVDQLRRELPEGSVVAVLPVKEEAAHQARALFDSESNQPIFQELGLDKETTLFVSWGTTTANLYWMADNLVKSTTVRVGVQKLLDSYMPARYGAPLLDEINTIMSNHNLGTVLFFNSVGFEIQESLSVLEVDSESAKYFNSAVLAEFFLLLHTQQPDARIAIKQRSEPKLDDLFLTSIGALPDYAHFEFSVDIEGGSARLKRRGENGHFRSVSMLNERGGKKLNANAVLPGRPIDVTNYIQAFVSWLNDQGVDRPVLVIFTGDVRAQLEGDPAYRLHFSRDEDGTP